MLTASQTYLKLLTAILGICAITAMAVRPTAGAEGSPRYKYDSSWRKPLPNNWALGGITGMFVDQDDHIWVLNRPRDLDESNNYATLNKRVMVYDWDTGKFKRGWGAYGKPLSEIGNDGQPAVGREGDPTAKDFKSPVHCVRIAKDGLVYVCDRAGNRVQVFTKDGKYLKEFFIARNTLMRGTAGSVDFSPDPQQKYIFVADIMNMVVWELERDTGNIVNKIGRAGHAGGEFTLVHVATMDSKGNLYTGEVGSGRRIQKFSPVN